MLMIAAPKNKFRVGKVGGGLLLLWPRRLGHSTMRPAVAAMQQIADWLKSLACLSTLTVLSRTRLRPCPQSDTSRRSRALKCRGDRPVRRDPNHGAVIWVELSVIDPTDTGGIERALAAFAHQPNGGVVVTASPAAVVHRELMISLPMPYRLPSAYPFRYYSASGPRLLWA
jgi:hypothetical protein